MAKEKQFWSEFLDLYQSMPALWKVKSEDYSNRVLKNTCYTKMVEKLNELEPDANREKVVKKINSFRSNYKRELKKIKKSEKSGTGADDVVESSLWYFDKLYFLEDQELSVEGRCSMEENEQQLSVPQPTTKKKFAEEDKLLQLACQKLNAPEDSNMALAKGWAAQYAELSKDQQLFARSVINDTLFHGGLNKLSEVMVEDVHKVYKGASVHTPRASLIRASTPYVDESSYSTQYTFSPPASREYLPNRPIIISNEAFSATSPQNQSEIVQYFTQFGTE